jgi:predicted RNase H-like nuclease (RuvC/YqgF family)
MNEQQALNNVLTQYVIENANLKIQIETSKQEIESLKQELEELEKKKEASECSENSEPKE